MPTLPPPIDFSENLKKLFFVENAQELKQGKSVAYLNDIPINLVQTVMDSDSFYNMSKFDRVFGISSVPDVLSDDVNDAFLTSATSGALATYITAVIGSLRKYFISPARAIKCKDPQDYKIAVRDMHIELFREVYKHVYGQAQNYSSMNEVFLYNPEGSGFAAFFMPMLSGLLTQVESSKTSYDTLHDYLSNVRSIIAVYNYDRYSMLSSFIKSLIYSVFYPYFVFLYILSFLGDLNINIEQQEKERSFYVHRVAKLACYMYVFHMIRHIYYLYTKDNATHMNDDNGLMMRRMIDNIALNVFDMENELMIDQKDGIPSYYNMVKQMSLNNKALSKGVAEKAVTFDLQKYNLTSVLSNETVINRDEKYTRNVYLIHVWVTIVVLFAAVALLATKMYLPFFLLSGFVMFGILAMAVASMIFSQ